MAKLPNNVTYRIKNLSSHKYFNVHIDNLKIAHQHKGEYHPYPIINEHDDNDLQEVNDDDPENVDDPQSITDVSDSSEDENQD